MDRRHCILKSLENSILSGILLGLEMEEGKLIPNGGHFPCCSGLGQREDAKQNLMLTCQMPKRLQQTQLILNKLYERWGYGASQSLLRDLAKKTGLLRHVSDTIKGYRPQGSVISGRLGKPSDFWPMALACTWRFGIRSHIITLSRVKIEELYPKQTSEPVAIFVEQVDKLWEPRHAELLEAIVSYGYSTNSFLWIEFCQQDKLPAPAASSNVNEKIKHRISHLKSKSPYGFLDKDCISRLKSLCVSPRMTLEGFNE